jgi:hypothetical protein
MNDPRFYLVCQNDGPALNVRISQEHKDELENYMLSAQNVHKSNETKLDISHSSVEQAGCSFPCLKMENKLKLVYSNQATKVISKRGTPKLVE